VRAGIPYRDRESGLEVVEAGRRSPQGEQAISVADGSPSDRSATRTASCGALPTPMSRILTEIGGHPPAPPRSRTVTLIGSRGRDV